MGKVEFAEQLKFRTKNICLELLKLFEDIKPTYEVVIIRSQLIKSAGSVAANYRAACRARSRAEFFSKMVLWLKKRTRHFFGLSY